MNIYLRYTGDPLAYFYTQRHIFYTGATHINCLRLDKFLVFFFSPLQRIFGYPSGLFERVFFVWYVLSLVVLWRKSKLFFFYALSLGMVPATSLNLVAFTRYFAVIIPAFILNSNPFASGKKRFWFCTSLVAMALLQFIYLFRHINNHWVA